MGGIESGLAQLSLLLSNSQHSKSSTQARGWKSSRIHKLQFIKPFAYLVTNWQVEPNSCRAKTEFKLEFVHFSDNIILEHFLQFYTLAQILFLKNGNEYWCTSLTQWGKSRNAKFYLNIITIMIYMMVTVFDAYEYDF